MYVVFPMMGLVKSGGVRVVVEVASGLAVRGHRVRLVLARPSSSTAFHLHDQVEIVGSPFNRGVGHELLWLARSIPREADAVISTFYLTAYPTAIATRFSGRGGYYLVQDYEPDFFVANPRSRAPWLQRLLAKQSYHLPLQKITISTWLQERLRESTGRDSVVIHDGVDSAVFSPATLPGAQPGGGPVVLALGRQDPRKGFAYLLEAIDLLRETVPAVRLVVATQDRALTVESPVPVEICYPKDDTELAVCYRGASVFAFPSLREGFGLPPLEAMACGVPVVTTDCGGVRDFAVDGENCLIVPPADPASMATAMRTLLTEPALARRLGQAGRATACRFAWDAMVDELERLLMARVS